MLTKPAKVYGKVPGVLTRHNPTPVCPTNLRPVATVNGQLRVTLLAPADMANVPDDRTVPTASVN